MLPESRFVPPDARCPHPERWHSADGDSTEIEVTELIAGLVRGLQPGLVVETGAAFGQTTFAICEALERNGEGVLVTFEIDPERRGLLIEKAADNLPGAARLWLGESSLDADEALESHARIDLAFLDSFYECRVPEFLHLHQWMRPGTIVAFHDTRPTAGAHRMDRSLREAIALELEDTGLLRAIDFPTPRGLTLGEVL